jgi:tRNA 2-thiouridine synthesizing protein A
LDDTYAVSPWLRKLLIIFFAVQHREPARITQLLIDVTSDTCPMTFVRARLQLDKLLIGEVLEVLYKGEEPRLNLARSLTEQGHEILAQEDEADGRGRLRIRKGG